MRIFLEPPKRRRFNRSKRFLESKGQFGHWLWLKQETEREIFGGAQERRNANRRS